MATGIITLLGTLAALVFWVMKRRAVRVDDPAYQNERRHEQIDTDIGRAVESAPGKATEAASADLTIHGGDDLDELERLQRAQNGGGEQRPNGDGA